MEGFDSDKNAKGLLAEKSNVTYTVLLVISGFCVMLFLCVGFFADSFWDVLKDVLVIALFLFSVYFRFFVPKKAVEYDSKGLYINKSFKRVIFIDYKSLGGAEGKKHFAHGRHADIDDIYNEINNVGSLKIFVKYGKDDYSYYTLYNIMDVPSVEIALNALRDKYNPEKKD